MTSSKSEKPASTESPHLSPGGQRLSQLFGQNLPQKRGAIISFVILALVTLAVMIIFLLIISPFILSLLAASMTALISYPLQCALSSRLGGRSYWSAGILTLLLALVVIFPLLLGAIIGVSQFERGVSYVQTQIDAQSPKFKRLMGSVSDHLNVPEEELRTRLKQSIESMLGPAIKWGRSAVGGILNAILQFGVILFAFFFFLAEGEKIVETWEKTTPIEAEHDRMIRQQFANVCRGAILGTLAAAIGQGIAMTIGLFFINLGTQANLGPWLVLFGGLTSIAALVPFLGASLVWVPLSITLYFNDHITSAIVVFLYGLIVISSIDNLIRILVLKGSAKLHPLLVVICVFGGLQFAGVLGIFIGPAVGAIVFALMKVLRQELTQLTDEGVTPATASPS